MSSNSVVIVMATFNGEKYLDEQLVSIEYQDMKEWKLYISDDGSSDNTLKIIHDFKQRMKPGQVVLLEGPKKGFVQNFLYALCFALSVEKSAPYFAFCDQDDVWLPFKLRRAIQKISQISCGALYCSATTLMYKEGILGKNTPPRKHIHFGNALVQSLAGANTMLFNRIMADYIKEFGSVHAVSHDWMAYQIACALGCIVVFDPKPSLLYRQHTSNVVGENKSLNARMLRLKALVKGRMKDWNDRNMHHLKRLEPLMSVEQKKIFDEYLCLRKGKMYQKITVGFKGNITRESRLDQIAMMCIIMLNRF